MQTVFKTDIGVYRENNEDSLYFGQNELGDIIAVVADGMGGHNAGEVASHIAVTVIEKEFKRANYYSPKEFLQNSILKVNEQIYSSALLHEEYAKMGTTMSVLFIQKDKIYTGHVGDSRIYYYNDQKDKMYQITKDHTLVQMLFEKGQITKEELLTHPYKNVLSQSLGINKKISIEINQINVSENGYFLICSDGLTDGLIDKKIQKILGNKENIKNKAEKLMKKALNSGTKDNITFILIER